MLVRLRIEAYRINEDMDEITASWDTLADATSYELELLDNGLIRKKVTVTADRFVAAGNMMIIMKSVDDILSNGDRLTHTFVRARGVKTTTDEDTNVTTTEFSKWTVEYFIAFDTVPPDVTIPTDTVSGGDVFGLGDTANPILGKIVPGMEEPAKIFMPILCFIISAVVALLVTAGLSRTQTEMGAGPLVVGMLVFVTLFALLGTQAFMVPVGWAVAPILPAVIIGVVVMKRQGQ